MVDLAITCLTCYRNFFKKVRIFGFTKNPVCYTVGVVSPIDRTKTPRIHGSVIQPGYASVSVDRVLKGYSNVPLDIEGGDGEKTLGETEKTFIQWRKRFIIIPGAPPLPLPHPRYE